MLQTIQRAISKSRHLYREKHHNAKATSNFLKQFPREISTSRQCNQRAISKHHREKAAMYIKIPSNRAIHKTICLIEPSNRHRTAAKKEMPTEPPGCSISSGIPVVKGHNRLTNNNSYLRRPIRDTFSPTWEDATPQRACAVKTATCAQSPDAPSQ